MVEARQWHNEELTEPRRGEYPLSASAVKKYKRCPAQFKFRYIDQLDGMGGSSPYSTLGSAVHEAIERVLIDNDVAELSKTPNQMRKKMMDEYRSINPDIAQKHSDTAKKCIQVAARYVVMQDVEEFRGIEENFTFALTRSDIDHSFRGLIDVATPTEVWDWKTGKNVYDIDEIIQGMIYAMGFLAKYGQPPEQIRFVYLQKEIERTIEPTDDNWQQMLDFARDAIRAKQSGDFEATPEESKCYWCGYEGYCDASPVGAGAVTWEHI
jgi:RecB family exonuclease